MTQRTVPCALKYHIAAYIVDIGGFVRDRSNPVDISEAGVYQDDTVTRVFDYHGGIRECYRWTDADPFLVAYTITPDGVEIKNRPYKACVDRNHTVWERWLMYYGK